MFALLAAASAFGSLVAFDASVTTRTWLGPDFWANNLQDWELQNGEFVCHETRQRFPVRTAMLLPIETTGDYQISVETAPLDGGGPGWCGFILGAGGSSVDYRISALVHQMPAEDGGILVGVTETGKPFVRDFSRSAGTDNGWSLSSDFKEEYAPEYPGRFAGIEIPGAVTLTVRMAKQGDSYQATLTGSAEGAEGWVYVVSDLPADRVEGMPGLMSHLGGSGHRFSQLVIGGPGVVARKDRRFGPVTQTMYTIQDGVLRLCALGVPLGPADSKVAALEIEGKNGFEPVATAEWNPQSMSYQFVVTGIAADRDRRFRVVTDSFEGTGSKQTSYGGILRAEPKGPETKAAVFTCFKSFTGNLKWNGKSIWAPHQEIVDAVTWHNPDIAIFTGDQIYEGDLTPARLLKDDARETYLDYLSKYYRFAIGMGELTRTRPSILIPDDHDVYHGNLWGAGGRQAVAHDGLTDQDAGGYKAHRDYVNALHESLTHNLPPPFDATPVGDMKIEPYTTEVVWGGVSFAVVADRMFKESASVALPAAKIVNGWSRNPNFDMARDSDVPSAPLLGEMQERFLAAWAKKKSRSIQFKAVVSGTVFQNPATIPDIADGGEVIPSLPIFDSPLSHPPNYKIAADCDSNGWPQSGRNRALRLMKQAGAIHLCGDQHLGTLTEYGIDSFRDGGFAFCVPAAANTWPRRWYPPAAGANRELGSPYYTGDFLDGFGNKMTVWAAANPYRTGQEPSSLYNRTPGYGIVRFNRRLDSITFECWPRWVDPSKPGAQQYLGWPKTIKNSDNR